MLEINFDNIMELLTSDKQYSSEDANKLKTVMRQLIESEIDSTQYSEYFSVFLAESSKPKYLRNLCDEDRNDWAELCFRIIQIIDFRLLDLLKIRTKSDPEKALFKTITDGNIIQEYSYEYISRFIREIATVFINSVQAPKVAIFCENSIESASSDLACLCYDILNTPLSIHFDNEILLYIFDLLEINIVVTDSEMRYHQLDQLRLKTKSEFIVCLTDTKIKMQIMLINT